MYEINIPIPTWIERQPVTINKQKMDSFWVKQKIQKIQKGLRYIFINIRDKGKIISKIRTRNYFKRKNTCDIKNHIRKLGNKNMTLTSCIDNTNRVKEIGQSQRETQWTRRQCWGAHEYYSKKGGGGFLNYERRENKTKVVPVYT